MPTSEICGTTSQGSTIAAPQVRVVRKTGRCATGYERDGGRVYHAILIPGSYFKALCGTKPGRLSAWSEHEAELVNCPRCLRKLAKLAA